jgi:serine/threonine-protein kinase
MSEPRFLKTPLPRFQTPPGLVKVLDFGLAKLRADDGAGAQATVMTHSPTLGPGGTVEGVILGTAAYMAPEQAKGHTADARSDTWAFGAVLYELPAGRPAFAGDTIVEILGGVVRMDPDWSALPRETAPVVRTLLRRRLQKDRSRRLHHIADARFQIEEALAELASPVAVHEARSRDVGGRLLAGIAVGAIASGVYFRRAPIPAPETRLSIDKTGHDLLAASGSRTSGSRPAGQPGRSRT